MRTILLLLLFCCGIYTATPGQAQFYPTQYRPHQQWEQLTTPHFNLVYARGNDSAALEMGRILEEQYPDVQQLVGGQLTGFPVILNDYNDRSNGFVTPIHFRSEIELPPIKGKSLNPQTGGWLENVGPHELVHALQFSNLGKNNLPRLVSLFSPDLARSFHGAIPSGITEGIAVYHETEGVSPGGGRGQFPFFTNQFNAVFDSDQRWSMGQMVQVSSNTRPFNRHYIGGHAFTGWLQETHGYETTRKTLGFYMNYPFLGYGVALRHTTGSWPGQLYEQFEKDKRQSLIDGPEAAARPQALSIPFKGREVRRPQWLSDSTLVFYGSFYNARPGFYRYNLESEKIKRLVTTNSVGDYRYDLSHDRSRMVYSYYDSDPIYDHTYKAELVEYELSTGNRRQLTGGGRLYAPQYDNDRLLALQTRPASAALVSIRRDRTTSEAIPLLSSEAYEITAVTRHQDGKRLAVIANKGGFQGLWIADRDNPEPALSRAPDISFENGAVFDPEWHPDGDKLLFSSGFSGTHQLYEYNLRDDSVIRITQAGFNAFEGAYSPDGARIAFIRQHTSERLPAVLRRTNAAGDRDTVSASLWRPSESQIQAAAMRHPAVSDSVVAASKTWSREPYSHGSGWLKPRTVLPAVNEISNRDRYQLGLSLHSNNLLQSQAYSAEISCLEEQLWYDLSYENKQFYPGFNMRLYSEPSYFRFNTTQNGVVTLLRENRSLAFSVPFDFQIDQNVFSSSFFIEPEFRYSQIRFRDVGLASNVTDFTNSAVSNLYGQFNFRLQQNIRDVQPNSGLVLFSELEHYWSASDLRFSNGEDEVELASGQPTALRAGIVGFLSPLRRWNQSLRLEVEGLSQSGPVFNSQSLVSAAFSEPVLATSDNLLSLSARYTIPLLFADDGGFLLPFYLNNLYLVAFSNSVTDPAAADWREHSRSVFGLELRTGFRISNLSFDIGIGYGYEPTRQNHQFFIGSF